MNNLYKFGFPGPRVGVLTVTERP